MQGLGFKVQGSRFRVQGPGFTLVSRDDKESLPPSAVSADLLNREQPWRNILNARPNLNPAP